MAKLSQTLIDRLSSPFKDIRGAAFVELATEKDNALIKALQLEFNGMDISTQAVEAACLLAEPAFFRHLYLMKWWWDEDEELLTKAVAACHPPKEKVEKLLAMSLELDEEMALTAKAQLWQLGSEEVFSEAVKMSTSDDWYIREKAAEILEGLGGPTLPFRVNTRPVLERLLSDRDKDVVSAAARALTAAKDPNLVSELLRLQHHPSIEVRVAVADGLAGAKGLDVMDALLDMLNARERQVRISSALALGMMESEEAIITALLARRGEKDPRVRGAVLYSLVLLEAKNMVTELQAELQQKRVDEYTLWAVRLLGAKELYDHLLKLTTWRDMAPELLRECLVACDAERAEEEPWAYRTVEEIIEEALAAEDLPPAIAYAVRILTYRGTIDCHLAAEELLNKEEVVQQKFGEELTKSLQQWARGEDPVACGKYWFSDVFARLAKWDWRRRIFKKDEIEAMSQQKSDSFWSAHPPVCTDGVHVMCLDIAKLHEFAAAIGLTPRLFTNHKHHPHYDLMTLDDRYRAIEAGVVPMTSRVLLKTFSSGRLRGRVKTVYQNWDGPNSSS